jgi:hypothetical protein
VERSNTIESQVRKENGYESEGTIVDDEPDLLAKDHPALPPLTRVSSPENRRRHSIEIFCDPSRDADESQRSILQPGGQRSAMKQGGIYSRTGNIGGGLFPVAPSTSATSSQRSNQGSSPMVRHPTDDEPARHPKLQKAVTYHIARPSANATPTGGAIPTKDPSLNKKSLVSRVLH